MRRLKPFFPIALAALMGGGIAQNLFAEEIGLVSEQCTQQDGRPRARGCQENICPQVQTDPFMYFDADYLFWARDSSNATRSIIGGPEAISAGGAGTEFEGGIRLKGGMVFECFELQLSWTQIDGWSNDRAGQLTNGISFDSGIGTSFAGSNFINNTTSFRAIAAAAEFNPVGGPNETLEDEGLGPVGVFADAPPTYSVSYRSDLRDFELTGKLANINSRIKLGVGWRHVDFNELMASSFTGTFRAVDNAVGANGGLSHTALTDTNGGNLTLISGAADGFDDETGLLGGVGPDLIRMEENVNAQNQLDGVQFTLDALVMESERYLIETILKVGVFNNNAEASLVETYSGIGNDNSVYSRTLADTSNNVAFVGQITLGGMYRVNDHFRLRAGWDVLFLSGLALAPEQAVLAGNTLILNNEGTAIVNGGHLGVEYVY